jgi:hypothetical protein
VAEQSVKQAYPTKSRTESCGFFCAPPTTLWLQRVLCEIHFPHALSIAHPIRRV